MFLELLQWPACHSAKTAEEGFASFSTAWGSPKGISARGSVWWLKIQLAPWECCILVILDCGRGKPEVTVWNHWCFRTAKVTKRILYSCRQWDTAPDKLLDSSRCCFALSSSVQGRNTWCYHSAYKRTKGDTEDGGTKKSCYLSGFLMR